MPRTPKPPKGFVPAGQGKAVGPLAPSVSLLCKIGSIMVHVEEMAGPKGHMDTFKSLMADPEVAEWMAGMRAMAMLPLKR